MGSRAVAPTLTDEELADFLPLTKGADTVEPKLTMLLSDRSRARAALGVDPLDGQIRQVFFLDTPDLVLNRGGLIVGARRVQGKRALEFFSQRLAVLGQEGSG
jgi:hypothetical protein